MNNAAVTLSSGTLTEGDTDLTTELENILAADTPWNVIVWNDPVNLMSYVSAVFREYFGYSAARAEELMMAVHTRGRATVSTGVRERIEADVMAMHSYGLRATIEADRD